MARRKPGLEFAGEKAWDAIRKAPAADAALLAMARQVCDAADAWAESETRSGDHPVERPHFEVVTEPGEHRARYTVRPATGYATWLVQQKPAEFMACLDAARR